VYELKSGAFAFQKHLTSSIQVIKLTRKRVNFMDQAQTVKVTF